MHFLFQYQETSSGEFLSMSYRTWIGCCSCFDSIMNAKMKKLKRFLSMHSSWADTIFILNIERIYSLITNISRYLHTTSLTLYRWVSSEQCHLLLQSKINLEWIPTFKWYCLNNGYGNKSFMFNSVWNNLEKKVQIIDTFYSRFPRFFTIHVFMSKSSKNVPVALNSINIDIEITIENA